MKATVLDTLTGDTAESEGIRSFEWAENNLSCDCNREILFKPFDFKSTGCDGCKRYIVVAAEFGADDYEYSLRDLNEGYPDVLLAENLPIEEIGITDGETT